MVAKRLRCAVSGASHPVALNPNKPASLSGIPRISASTISAAILEKIIPLPPYPMTAKIFGCPGTVPINGRPVLVEPYDPAPYTAEFVKTYTAKWNGLFKAR